MTQVEQLAAIVRSSNNWQDVQVEFDTLANMAEVPDDWKNPAGGYAFSDVVAQIEQAFNVKLDAENKGDWHYFGG